MITKTFTQDGRTCRVTFRLSAAVESAALLGDFNLWNPEANPLLRGEDGSLGVTLALAPGDYRFRYLVDGGQWLNDDAADALVPNSFGSADSVVAVAPVELAGEEPEAEAAATRPRTTRRPAPKKAAAKIAQPEAKASAKPRAAKPRAAKPKKPATSTS